MVSPGVRFGFASGKAENMGSRAKDRRIQLWRLEAPDRFSPASKVRGFEVTRPFGQPGGMNWV
jgi:hypothetical protein